MARNANTAEKATASFRDQVASLRAEIKECEKTRDALRSDCEQVKKELDDAREAFGELKRKARAEVIESATKEANAEKQKIQSEVLQLKGEKDQIESELLAIREENDKLKSASDTIKAESTKVEEESTKKRRDADDYAKKTRTEADSYSKTTKADADKYKTDSETLAKKYDRDIRKAADDYYASQKESADQLKNANEEEKKRLAELNEALSARESRLEKDTLEYETNKQDAINGYAKTLATERAAFEKELQKVKDLISKESERLNEEKRNVDTQVAQYRTKKMAEVDASIIAAQELNKKEQERLAGVAADLKKQEAELNIAKSAAQAAKEAYDNRSANLDNEVQKRFDELCQKEKTETDTYRTLANKLTVELAENKKELANLKKKLNETKGSDIALLREDNKQLKDENRKLKEAEEGFYGKLRKFNVDPEMVEKFMYKAEQYDQLLKKWENQNRDIEKLNEKIAEVHITENQYEQQKRVANDANEKYEAATRELTKLKQPDRAEKLSRFTSFSAFDNITNLPAFGPTTSETTWLRHIKDQLEASGIEISDRLLYAFHTSVKIHDWSPLVVLAGVSGTGKSELPRQYAQHGGMNFVSIPVKPDWDSMQSLFGYYNSIENKFEPTELSKAIYYMKDDKMKDTMLLVLLDEMNLAYVELYFADLLSKFETNRGTNNVITYDLTLGAKETPEEMFIGNNILWVGTMNEDETTKALSDKVVDRSTLLTFPRPKTLKSRSSKVKIPDAEKRLTRGLWNKWCENTIDEEDLKGNSNVSIEYYRDIIQRINATMSKVNRNLGHRVWQSIERYVFSHPMVLNNRGAGAEFKKQFDLAFAEAVAFKVMPKLRGIEVSGDSKKVLQEIEGIISADVPSLAEDFKQAMSLSSRIFQWCSAKFLDADNNN